MQLLTPGSINLEFRWVEMLHYLSSRSKWAGTFIFVEYYYFIFPQENSKPNTALFFDVEPTNYNTECDITTHCKVYVLSVRIDDFLQTYEIFVFQLNKLTVL